MQDDIYMARALKLAQPGRFTTHPNRMSGASLSKMAKLSARYHQPAGEPYAESTRVAYGWKPKAQRQMHSNPVAIMAVRHRAVTHSSPRLERVVAAMQDPNPQVAGRDFTVCRLALTSANG